MQKFLLFCLICISATIQPVAVFAQDNNNSGLTGSQIKQINDTIQNAKGVVILLKPALDSTLGKVPDLSQEQVYFDYIKLIAGVFGSLFLVIEIARIVSGKSKLNTLLLRLIFFFTAFTIYPAICYATLFLANSLYKALLGSVSYSDFLNQLLDKLIVKQDGWQTFWNSVNLGNYFAMNSVTLVGISMLLTWGMLIISVLSMFTLAIGNIFLKMLFIASPFVAIFHIFGKATDIPVRFWNFWFAFLVRQLGFCLGIWIVTTTTLNKINENNSAGTLNFAFAFEVLAAIIAIPGFAILISEIFSNYYNRSVDEATNNTKSTAMVATVPVAATTATIMNLKK